MELLWFNSSIAVKSIPNIFTAHKANAIKPKGVNCLIIQLHNKGIESVLVLSEEHIYGLEVIL